VQILLLDLLILLRHYLLTELQLDGRLRNAGDTSIRLIGQNSTAGDAMLTAKRGMGIGLDSAFAGEALVPADFRIKSDAIAFLMAIIHHPVKSNKVIHIKQVAAFSLLSVLQFNLYFLSVKLRSMATLTTILEELLEEAKRIDAYIAENNLPPLSHQHETFTSSGVPVEIQTCRDRLINGCANARALVEGPAIATLNIAFNVRKDNLAFLCID
jgi:hypothetical protein